MDANSITNNMFSVKYQLCSSMMFTTGDATELLTYAMVKTYLEDIEFSAYYTKANKI
jgi:hypothetical protein